MTKLEEAVRSLVHDGLVWGASKLVPIGYGIKKLQIKYVLVSCKQHACLLDTLVFIFANAIACCF